MFDRPVTARFTSIAKTPLPLKQKTKLVGEVDRSESYLYGGYNDDTLSKRPSSPTKPRRKTSTQAMKIAPINTSTHDPSELS